MESLLSASGVCGLKSALVQQLYVRILRVLLCVWFSPELWFSAKHCEV